MQILIFSIGQFVQYWISVCDRMSCTERVITLNGENYNCIHPNGENIYISLTIKGERSL